MKAKPFLLHKSTKKNDNIIKIKRSLFKRIFFFFLEFSKKKEFYLVSEIVQ